MKTKPPIARMHDVLYGTLQTLAHEKNRFKDFWSATWQPTLAESQESVDAVSHAHAIGDSPKTAASLFLVSGLQAVTHNVSVSVLNDPTLVANPNVQNLMEAIAACRDDASITKHVNDVPPFASQINADGSITLSEYPAPEPAPEE